jgi:tetratricopeptide (TPR) repeat protein
VAGQVQKAQDLLKQVDENAPGRQALTTLIAAVTLKEKSTSTLPQTASDWIAESYYRQSKSDLAGALQAAERAAQLDANSGFAWTRVAESRFNLGRASEAKEALEKGLKFSPRNPAAHALRGFLLSAENNLKDAKDSFDTAIALHSALGDGWLGRGLCLIKQGHVEAGRHDLFVAAALEPNRAMFRRYLSENSSIVTGGTPTPNKLTSRPEKTSRLEKTSRAEKAASSKQSHVQASPRPAITPAPAPYPVQQGPDVQIGLGIGRGQRYTYPSRRGTPPPQSGGSGHPQQGESGQQTPSHGSTDQGRQIPRPIGKPIKKRTPPPSHVN